MAFRVDKDALRNSLKGKQKIVEVDAPFLGKGAKVGFRTALTVADYGVLSTPCSTGEKIVKIFVQLAVDPQGSPLVDENDMDWFMDKVDGVELAKTVVASGMFMKVLKALAEIAAKINEMNEKNEGKKEGPKELGGKSS